jgi:drug/metabolite transporter (DMT)-like permease
MPPLPLFQNLSAPVRAALWMTASALGYGVSAVIVRHLTRTMPVFEIVFIRNVFALLFMAPWLMRVGLGALRTDHPGRHLVRGAFSAINVWFLFGALALAPVADVAAISFLMPVVGSIFAVLFLKEVTSGRLWGATFIGFLGAVIVIRPGMAAFNLGLIFALVSVLAGATVSILIKTLVRTDTPDTIAAYLFIWHTLFSIIPAIMVWQVPSLAELFWCAMLGLFATMVQRCFNRSMALADATVVLPFNFSRLIWAALFGFLAFAEIPDLWTWVGGGVIFASSIYITRFGMGRTPPG